MTLREVTTVEMVVAAVAGVAFMGLYLVRSPWRKSAMGQHLAAFMGVLTGILLLWIGHRLAGGFPTWVWVVALGAFDLVMIWRAVLLFRTQNGHTPGEHDSAADHEGQRR